VEDLDSNVSYGKSLLSMALDTMAGQEMMKAQNEKDEDVTLKGLEKIADEI